MLLFLRPSQKSIGNHLRRSLATSTPSKPTSVVVELRRRGFVQELTSENFVEKTLQPTSVYLGLDPSARSLHAGNLLALLALLHFQNHGHQAIALIGGATGSIGDPSGRSSERNFLSPSELNSNVLAITNQVTSFFEKGQAYASKRSGGISSEETLVGEVKEPKVLNNLDWIQEISLLEFLRTVGKGAKVQTMLNRDSVRTRLTSSSGISFTEFTYQLLQAKDFLHLHLNHNCSAQIGGSDQLGNIQAGTDLVARHYYEKRLEEEHKSKVKGEKTEGAKAVAREQVFGLTIPLLTTSSGEKFGKSVGNPVWLDEKMTSVFDFYQFFVRALDSDVEKYLKMFTLLSVERIEEIMASHSLDTSLRSAQKILASEVTELVHGELGLQRALTATSAIYQTDLNLLTTDAVLSAFTNDPRLVRVSRSSLPLDLPRLAAEHKVAGSRKKASLILSQGGFYLNGSKVAGEQTTLNETDLLDGQFAVLKVGKTGDLVVVVDDEKSSSLVE
ncbi:tyrosine-tRNA ligase [Mrakia frigida]|uniref:tyrosine--tRNA ligase MSY1 n=1 Tax=Mrakia frigida TaxID=29902 RepID=UPI003FCC0325